jgi:hypothetical protein
MAQSGASGDHARKACGAALEKFADGMNENLVFSGIDANHGEFSPEDIQQLVAMLPGDDEKLVLIDSVCESALANDLVGNMRLLRNMAASGKATVIMTVHADLKCGKRPHFIEEDDLPLLEKYQRHCDSLLVMFSEKVNLRRFVAMLKGQIDAQLVGSLEQRALQLAGGKRLKSDTYSLVRLVHSRSGRREVFLFLYQPDLIRLFELAGAPMSRS